MSADRTMSHAELFCGGTEAPQASRGFKGAQRIQ
jgi:hypothetical protein